MRGQEVILLNFPISHFLKSLAHSGLTWYLIQIPYARPDPKYFFNTRTRPDPKLKNPTRLTVAIMLLMNLPVMMMVKQTKKTSENPTKRQVQAMIIAL